MIMGWNMWLLMDQELKPKRRRNTLFNNGKRMLRNSLALFQVGLLPNKQIGLNG
jgi:hypothetical protein